MRGLKGDLPVQPMKKHMALSLIRSRLWDPLDGPNLRKLANELSGGMMAGPVSDDFMMAAFDRAMSSPESLIAVQILTTPPPLIPPYAGPSIGPAPAPRQAPRKVVDQAVVRMSMEDRFKAALEVTKEKLGPAFAEQIDALLTPENLGIMAALLVIWAGGHAFGVSEVVDAILLVVGLVMLGMAAIDAAEKLIKALDLIANAQNRDDLREAGLLFAEVIAIIGVTALLSLLMWMAGKAGAKPKGGNRPPPPPAPKQLPPGSPPPKQLPPGPPPPKQLPPGPPPPKQLPPGPPPPKQLPPGPPAKPPPIARQKQDGHVAGTPQNANRIKQGKPTSTFNGSKAEADALVQEAWAKGTPVPGRPGVKDYNVGKPIGTSPSGASQSTVRVHQDASGAIHGHPSGPGT